MRLLGGQRKWSASQSHMTQRGDGEVWTEVWSLGKWKGCWWPLTHVAHCPQAGLARVTERVTEEQSEWMRASSLEVFSFLFSLDGFS